MYTPWGEADSVKVIDRGFVEVQTPGHGGFMLTQRFAAQNLSLPAIRRGEKYGNYLAYEEDCDWAIVAFELRRYWDKLFEEKEKKNIEDLLLKTLSRWHPDYLLEKGLRPIPELYKDWQMSRECDERRRKKDPDLIVSAIMGPPGTCEVTTANGKVYTVAYDSYTKQQTPLKLLSKCVLME